MMVFFILLQLFFLDACYAQDDSDQSIAEEYGLLPQCSLACFDNASQYINCDPTDYTCICQTYNEIGEETAVSSVASCIQNSCSAGNITATFTLFNHICIIILDTPDTDSSSVPQTIKTFSFGVSSTLAVSSTAFTSNSTTLTTISTSKTTSSNFTAITSSTAEITSNSLSVSSTQPTETKGASSPPGSFGISSNTLKPEVVAGIILAIAGFLLALAIGSRLLLRRKIMEKFRWKKDFKNLPDDSHTQNAPGSGGNLPPMRGVQVSHQYSVTSHRIPTPQTSASILGNAPPPTTSLSRYGTQRRSRPLPEILEESPSEATSSENESPTGLTARPSLPKFPIPPNQKGALQGGQSSHHRLNSQDLDLPFDIPEEKPDIPPRSPYRSSMAVSPLTPSPRREVAGDLEREYFPGKPLPNLREGNKAPEIRLSYPFRFPSRAPSAVIPEPPSHFSIPSSSSEPRSSRQSFLLTKSSSTTSQKSTVSNPNRLTFPQPPLTLKTSLFNPNNSSHTSMPLPLPPPFHLTPRTHSIPNFSLPASKRRKHSPESSKSGSLGLPLQGSTEQPVQDQEGRSYLLENSEESKSSNEGGIEWYTPPEMPRSGDGDGDGGDGGDGQGENQPRARLVYIGGKKGERIAGIGGP